MNPIFYREGLNRLTYASWLADNAVRYVALPSAKPDKSSYGERALIEKGLPYLRLRWKSDDWRVYEVLLAAPLVISQKDARILLEQFQSDELLLDVKRPGEAIVKVRWTPYWFASNACVEPYGDWTKVIADKVGFVHMSTRFAPERLISARPPLRRLCGLGAGRLEELDRVAGGIVEQDLLAAGTAHDVVAEGQPRGAQPVDLAGEVLHD